METERESSPRLRETRNVPWMRYYKAFVNHLERHGKVLIPEDHVCHPNAQTCTHWSIPNTDFYVCEQSGLVHQCTQDTCHCMVETHEHYVCPISGRIYAMLESTIPMTLDVSASGMGGGVPLKERFTGEYSQAMEEEKKRVEYDEKQKEKIYALILKATKKLLWRPERKHADDKRVRQFHKRVRYSYRRYMGEQRKHKKPVYWHFLYNIYLYEDAIRSALIASPYSDDELLNRCRLYAHKAMEWYFRVEPLVHRETGEKYDPFFHTVAYLYASAEGVRDELRGEVELLPSDPFLQTALPPQNCLRDLHIKPRSFTKHQFTLIRLLAELIAKQQR